MFDLSTYFADIHVYLIIYLLVIVDAFLPRIHLISYYKRIYTVITLNFNFRNDRYYNTEPQRVREPRPYDRMYDYPERRRADANKRQGRIIYYANLPDIPRPDMHERDRYDSRFDNRFYDDRYYSPYPYRRDPVPYPNRKAPVRPRYEERSMEKVPYTPTKGQSNESGREAKKNPERRLYNENERGEFTQNNSQR